MANDEKKSLEARRALKDERKVSNERIYRTLMRNGGEPFGAPFEVGVPTLTERIVKLFKQLGFFRFETMERLARRTSRNKFTRHGSAPYLGEHERRKRK